MKTQFALGLLSGIVGIAVLFWMFHTTESSAEIPLSNVVAQKCVCSEPSPRFDDDDASEGQIVSSILHYCKCGNLTCVIAKGTFGGMGGRGKNYGISCVK